MGFYEKYFAVFQTSFQENSLDFSLMQKGRENCEKFPWKLFVQLEIHELSRKCSSSGRISLNLISP